MSYIFDAVEFTVFLNTAFESCDIRLVDEYGNGFYPSGVNPASLVNRASRNDGFRLDLMQCGGDYVGGITFSHDGGMFEVEHYTDTDEVCELLEQFDDED